MNHIDLFSGIGGFALAAETVWGKDYQNILFCDNEPFAQAIIKKHWPEALIYDDIRSLTYSEVERSQKQQVSIRKGRSLKTYSYAVRCDLLTGGVPVPTVQSSRTKKRNGRRPLSLA